MVTIKQINKVSKQIMDIAHDAMQNSLDASYYVADDAIDKLDRLATAYGKRTGSEFINHANFRMLRMSNGIVDMHALRQSLQDDVKKAKKNADVDRAISDTHALDNLKDFDFTMKYGADENPANDFYNNPDPEALPTLNGETVINDIKANVEQYTVGPDIMYMFMKDFRKNVLQTKEA